MLLDGFGWRSLQTNHPVDAFYTTVNQQLPFSMEPEYQAAQRAYMRYHK